MCHFVNLPSIASSAAHAHSLSFKDDTLRQMKKTPLDGY
jgi:hypothetical protein